MAEALGVVASVIALIQITEDITRLSRDLIHTKRSVRTVLGELLTKMTGYKRVFEDILLAAELDESDEARLSALQHVEGPLQACTDALFLIKAKLEKPSVVPKLAFGNVLPGKVQAALRKLDDLLPIFQFALQADQRLIARAVENYVQNIHQDMNDLQKINSAIEATVTAHYIDATRRRLDDEAAKVEEEAATKERKRLAERTMILNWISGLDTTEKYTRTRALHEPGTGEWFLRGLDFAQWMSAKKPNLWLLWYTISQFDGGCALAFFYFDFNDPDRRSHINMLQSLIMQLGKVQSHLPETLVNFYGKHATNRTLIHTQPTALELLELLVELVGLNSETYIVVDGLDECNRSEIMSLMASFRYLVSHGPDSCRLLCASRIIDEIQTTFTMMKFTPVGLQTAQVDLDIAVYVRATLRNDPDFADFRDDVKKVVEEALVTGSQGMFRWAQCQLDSLKQMEDKRPKIIKTALKSLPDDIDETYQRMLLSVHSSSREMLRRVLLLVCFGQPRKLSWTITLEEAAEFAVVDQNSTEIDADSRFDRPEQILRFCKSFFVTTSSTFGTSLRFAHYTVKEYLTSSKIKASTASWFAMDVQSGEREIASICMSYLSCTAHIPQPPSEQPAVVWLRENFEKFPLFYYAVKICEDLPTLFYNEADDIAVQRLVSKSICPTLWSWWMISTKWPCTSLESALISIGSHTSIPERDWLESLASQWEQWSGESYTVHSDSVDSSVAANIRRLTIWF